MAAALKVVHVIFDPKPHNLVPVELNQSMPGWSASISDDTGMVSIRLYGDNFLSEVRGSFRVHASRCRYIKVSAAKADSEV